MTPIFTFSAAFASGDCTITQSATTAASNTRPLIDVLFDMFGLLSLPPVDDDFCRYAGVPLSQAPRRLNKIASELALGLVD